MLDTMGVASSRIQLRDEKEEGQQKFGGKSLIVSPHSVDRRHQ